jgi:hypothetical protein
MRVYFLGCQGIDARIFPHESLPDFVDPAYHQSVRHFSSSCDYRKMTSQCVQETDREKIHFSAMREAPTANDPCALGAGKVDHFYVYFATCWPSQ